MRTSCITVKGLEKAFYQGGNVVSVLKNISISFKKDKTYAIAGASGSGKSTLLHLLSGLDKPTKGLIFVDDQNLALFSNRQKDDWLNSSIGLVFQNPYLIKELTVLENVMAKGLTGKMPYDECKKTAQQFLGAVGLSGKEGSLPSVLSGGQQQRVALARALMNKPDFLIADEPTGNLDDITGKNIINLLLDFSKKWHMGLIISSHDAYVAKKMDEVLTLKDGKFI